MKYINTIGDSGCPCGKYEDKDTKIIAHCWRTGYKDCECQYAGVHYKGNKETAEKIAEDIKDSYRCDVDIVKL